MELASWHFGGGSEYCAACTEVCAECPYDTHAPQTDAGKTAWDALKRCGGQVRTTGTSIYGLDFGAVLAFGGALGADLGMIADVLPAVEVALVRAYREGVADAD